MSTAFDSWKSFRQSFIDFLGALVPGVIFVTLAIMIEIHLVWEMLHSSGIVSDNAPARRIHEDFPFGSGTSI